MTRWFILPGMGATSAMYDSLQTELDFKVNFIDWPEYKGEKTFGDIAERVIEENGISDGDVVGGSSLGGMVALEIARQVKTKFSLLIGSAINRSEVQKVLIALAPLAEITPLSLIQILAGKNNNLVSQMFSESNPNFIRAMCSYLSTWPGYSGSMDSAFRIHGRKDHVIPCPLEGAEVVDDAGHLLAITHPKECARLIASRRSLLQGI